MKTILLIWIVNIVAVSSHSYHCAFHQYANSNHYQTKMADPISQLKSHKLSSQNKSSHQRLLYGAGRPAMRITLNLDDLSTVKTTTHGQNQTTLARLAFIKRAMQVTQVFFESRLQVSSQSSVDIPTLCFDFPPPAPDPTNNIAGSDLHIYVLYTTDNTKGYGATGVSCQWNPTSGGVDTTLKAGRPTVGRIIYNTYTIIDSKGALTNRLFAAVTATSIHETIHILGFDQSLYSTYLDYTTGLPYTQVTESVTLNAARTGGVNHIMKTPFVTAWAKAHFGCASLTGMALQNQQSLTSNVRGSHWQRLAMYDELMTGTQLGPQKSITGLTFALLKDMGWYGVNDVFNDTTNYGKNLGCSFYNDACYSSTSFDKYFCNPANNVNVTSCSTTFTGKATCSNQAALMADGCGMYMQQFNCVDPSVTGDFYQSFTLQSFGTNVFCAKGTISTAGITTNYRGRCYPFACNYNDNSITFTISSSYTLYCFSNEQGTNKTVSGMQGVFQCPIFADFCTNSRKICPNWCSGKGICTRGVCNCYFDQNVTYSGADCSISTCTTANTYYDTTTSSCVPTCPSRYYASTLSRACLRCDSSCNQCRDQSTICTSCTSTPSNPQYYYTAGATCVSVCPSDTYLSTDTCISCNSGAGCLTCANAPNQCRSCIDPAKYLNELFQCVTTCGGTYNKYDNINKKCQQTCPNQLINSGGYCIRCTPNYKKIDQLSNTCYPSCPASYYTDSTNYICGNCNETCKECYGKYSQNCTSCWSNSTLKYWHLDMCVGTCPSGFYTQTTLGKCQICTLSLHCNTCYLNVATVLCSSCKYGYYLQANGSCTTGCDSTKYPNKWNHTCDPCHGDCKDCNGPYESSCVNCNSPKYYIKNSTGGYCITQCPSVKYLTFMSTTCLACHETCNTCINQTSSGCATCVPGLYLQSNKCRYVCSPLKYPNQTSKSCLSCDIKCQYCFGGTVNNCTRCASGYMLNNFTCTTSCPEGQKPNAYQICQKVKYQLVLTVCFALMMTLIAFV